MMKYFYLIMLMFISRSNAQVKFCNPVNPNIGKNIIIIYFRLYMN